MILDLIRRLTSRQPKERVCYLHIGPHKTGTTSIQQALWLNARRLEKIGISYPSLSDPAGKQRRNHTPLARVSNFKGVSHLREAPFWSELDGKLAAMRGSVVISSEHFAIVMRDPARFDQVVRFFEDRGFRIVVIAYVRDQPGWMNSWYTQDQKNFASRQTFRQFEARIVQAGHLDPNVFLKRFFEHPRIEVRPISFERASGEGLVRGFFDLIGAPQRFRLIEPPRAYNPNAGVKGIWAAREIMRQVRIPIRSLPNYVQLYDQFRTLMRDRGWEKEPYIGFTQKDYDRIRARFRKGNDRFARKHFGADWRTLSPDRTYERAVFDFEGASEEDRRDVMEIVDKMVAIIKASPGYRARYRRYRRLAARKKRQRQAASG